jgi:hypothetical protein
MAEETSLIVIVLAGLILGAFIGILGAKIAISIKRIIIKRRSRKAFMDSEKQKFQIGNKIINISKYDIGLKEEYDIKNEILKQERGETSQKTPKQEPQIKRGLFGLFNTAQNKPKEPIQHEAKKRTRKKRNKRI